MFIKLFSSKCFVQNLALSWILYSCMWVCDCFFFFFLFMTGLKCKLGHLSERGLKKRTFSSEHKYLYLLIQIKKQICKVDCSIKIIAWERYSWIRKYFYNHFSVCGCLYNIFIWSSLCLTFWRIAVFCKSSLINLSLDSFFLHHEKKKSNPFWQWPVFHIHFAFSTDTI